MSGISPLEPGPYPWGLRSLRARITIWCGVLIAFCLGAYSAGAGFSFSQHLREELDRRVHEDIELAARALVLDEGKAAWAGGFLGKEMKEEEGGGHRIEVWSLSGKLLLEAGTIASLKVPPPRLDDVLRGGQHSIALSTGSVRVATEIVSAGEIRFLVRAAVAEAGSHAQVRRLWIELGTLSLVVFALGGAGSWLLARHAMGPLGRMAEQARRITAADLHGRLPEESASSELDQLRNAFNETLARLEGSFGQLRRFTADAAHELRTPLTALRTVGEVGLGRARGEEDLREVIGAMLEEVDRLSQLAGDLLSLARAESGQSPLRTETIDLTSLAAEVSESLHVLAEERDQVLELSGAGAVPACGDRLALRRALLNLVDNAIKYGPEGSTVRIVTGKSGNESYAEVSDEGPGIPAEHVAHVFDRFYRVDEGRSRDRGGTGLGLALVKWTAEAHGGRVELRSEPGRGSTFRLVLPVSAAKSPMPGGARSSRL